jgi:hypothetical protein
MGKMIFSALDTSRSAHLDLPLLFGGEQGIMGGWIIGIDAM